MAGNRNYSQEKFSGTVPLGCFGSQPNFNLEGPYRTLEDSEAVDQDLGILDNTTATILFFTETGYLTNRPGRNELNPISKARISRTRCAQVYV